VGVYLVERDWLRSSAGEEGRARVQVSCCNAVSVPKRHVLILVCPADLRLLAPAGCAKLERLKRARASSSPSSIFAAPPLFLFFLHLATPCAQYEYPVYEGEEARRRRLGSRACGLGVVQQRRPTLRLDVLIAVSALLASAKSPRSSPRSADRVFYPLEQPNAREVPCQSHRASLPFAPRRPKSTQTQNRPNRVFPPPTRFFCHSLCDFLGHVRVWRGVRFLRDVVLTKSLCPFAAAGQCELTLASANASQR
jgi:hypothetical protein